VLYIFHTVQEDNNVNKYKQLYRNEKGMEPLEGGVVVGLK
jgi:hypothetical protein